MFLAKMRTFNPFKRSKFMLFFQFGDYTVHTSNPEEKSIQEKKGEDKTRTKDDGQ